MKIDKCNKCEWCREQWVGKDLNTLFTYCGLIERVCENALDIKEIKECPRDYIFNKYRNNDNS